MDVFVNVVLLAAGSGTRIGRPKINLKIGDRYFLDIICENIFLSGLRNIYAVIANNMDTEKFKFREKINWVKNPHPERGMISSVYHGVSYSPKADGYLIVPVDHPMILRKTFSALYNVFVENPNCVVIAAFENTLGHPIIIPFSLAKTIENKDYPGGLRTLIKNSGIELISVETDDPGVLKNINTKEDLENLF